MNKKEHKKIVCEICGKDLTDVPKSLLFEDWVYTDLDVNEDGEVFGIPKRATICIDCYEEYWKDYINEIDNKTENK